MIGYVIGLGDRHLDNVLLDSLTGEIVHIDFNVCFEKGLRLRVPETVPFRLTQNLRHPLGLCGVDGLFRTTCQSVLEQLRSNRETLLTLLEAFVYDPLVDWTSDSRAAAEQQAMEIIVARTLAAARITELRSNIQQLEERFILGLPPLKEALEACLGPFRSRNQVLGRLSELQNENEIVTATIASFNLLENNVVPKNTSFKAETSKASLFLALEALYAEEQSAYSLRDEALSQVMKHKADAENWQTHHNTGLAALKGAQLTAMEREVMETYASLPFCKATHIKAKEFLDGSGHSNMVQQSIRAHAQLFNAGKEIQDVLCGCVKAIETYRAIAMEYPHWVLTTNRCYFWHEQLRTLLQQPSSAACDAVVLASHPTAIPGEVEACRKAYEQVKEVAQWFTVRQERLVALRAKEPNTVEQLAAAAHNALSAAWAKASTSDEPSSNAASILACAVIRTLLPIRAALSPSSASRMSISDLSDWLAAAHNALNLAPPPPVLDGPDRLSMVVSILNELVLAFDSLSDTLLFMNLREALRHTFQSPTPPAFAADWAALVAEATRCAEERGPQVTALRKLFSTIMASCAHAQTLSLSGLPVAAALLNNCFTQIDLILNNLGAFVSDLPGAAAAALGQLLDSLFVRRVKILVRLVDILGAQEKLFLLRWDASTDVSLTQNLNSVVDMVDDFIQCSRELLDTICGAFVEKAALMRLEGLGWDSGSVGGKGNCGDDADGRSNSTMDSSKSEHIAEGFAKVSEDSLFALVMEINSLVTKTVFTDISQAVEGYVRLHARQQRALRLDGNLRMGTECVQWHSLQITRFEWLRGELLQDLQPIGPSCASVVSVMYNSSQRVVAMLPTMRAAHEQYGVLEQTIQQRLSWAAGTNRQLAPALSAYSEAVSSRTQITLSLAKVANMLAGLASILAHFETFRLCSTDSSRARSADIGTLDATNVTAVIALGQALSQIEGRVMKQQALEAKLPSRLKSLAPHGHISRDWLIQRSQILPSQISGAKSELMELEVAARAQVPVLDHLLLAFRDHTKGVGDLMAELDSLLAPIVKAGSGPACTAAAAHRSLLDELHAITACLGELRDAAAGGFNHRSFVHILLDRDSAPALDPLSLALAFIASLRALEKIDNVDDTRVDVEATADTSIASGSTFASMRVGVSSEKGETTNIASFTGVVQSTSVTEDKEGTGASSAALAEQERNVQATGVWRRVRAKLEGRDTADGARRSPSEQAERLIRDAVSEGNLCQMYEGWAPWI